MDAENRWQLLLSLLLMIAAQAQQPMVTILERSPSRRSAGIIALPNGSPWCRGRPTVWMPGHKDFIVDQPDCYVNRTWTQPGWTKFDIIDDLNKIDNPTVIDRHACGAVDVNNDGLQDIYCLVGANKGRGLGFNELYISQKNGSLRKVRRHGLQRFNGTRTRLTTTLNGPNRKYVFISADHKARADGKRNLGTMFLLTGRPSRNPDVSYFRVISGPWASRQRTSTCAISGDVNGDGMDDLIMCNHHNQPACIFQQTRNGGFMENPLILNRVVHRNWRNARLGDFNGDGKMDIAIVYHGTDESILRVFLGISGRPYFSWHKPYFVRRLPFAAPDLEVIDANGDGNPDIYVVQADEREFPNRDTYCGGKFSQSKWYKGGNTPPKNFIPPRDRAADFLFINEKRAKRKFRPVRMKHSVPGCGAYVKKLGRRSVVLAHGGFDRPGFQSLLEWK